MLACNVLAGFAYRSCSVPSSLMVADSLSVFSIWNGSGNHKGSQSPQRSIVAITVITPFISRVFLFSQSSMGLGAPRP